VKPLRNIKKEKNKFQMLKLKCKTKENKISKIKDQTKPFKTKVETIKKEETPIIIKEEINIIINIKVVETRINNTVVVKINTKEVEINIKTTKEETKTSIKNIDSKK